MTKTVRFAPSPTGALHIGGIKTALINFLYAKKNKGSFLLRIEDTDQKRKVIGSEEYIKNSLSWLGIWDEKTSVFKQSERKDIYLKHIEKLLKKGDAYHCFETKENLEKKRKDIRFKYNSQTRHVLKNSLTLNKKKTEALLKEKKFVVRLKTKENETVIVKDYLRGNISINTNELEDKVLLKEDGLPTYHFANVVDDFEMGITTVIRGEEWISSLPIHYLIYTAFGWSPPEFIHLPLILNPSGKGKLSKRHGEALGFSVFPLSDEKMDVSGLKEDGILPEALLNYLVLLGWNPKNNEEVFETKDLIESFEIKGLQKKGAAFDYNKLLWINRKHLEKKNENELFSLYKNYKKGDLNINIETFREILIKTAILERLTTLKDLDVHFDYILNSPEKYNDSDIEKIISPVPESAKKVLDFALSIKLEEDNLKPLLLDFAKKNNLSAGFVMQTIRIAIVGKLFGIDLFKIIKIIKTDEAKKRIKSLLSHIEII